MHQAFLYGLMPSFIVALLTFFLVFIRHITKEKFDAGFLVIVILLLWHFYALIAIFLFWDQQEVFFILITSCIMFFSLSVSAGYYSGRFVSSAFPNR